MAAAQTADRPFSAAGLADLGAEPGAGPAPLLRDAREAVRACPLLALRLERVNR